MPNVRYLRADVFAISRHTAKDAQRLGYAQGQEGLAGRGRIQARPTNQRTEGLTEAPPQRAPPGTGTRKHVGQQGHEEESKTHEAKARLEKLPPQLLHGPPVGAVGGWVGGGSGWGHKGC